MAGGNIHAPQGLEDIPMEFDAAAPGPSFGAKIGVIAPGETVYGELNNLVDNGVTGVRSRMNADGSVEVYVDRGGVAAVQPTLTEYEVGKWRLTLAAEA